MEIDTTINDMWEVISAQIKLLKNSQPNISAERVELLKKLAEIYKAIS